MSGRGRYLAGKAAWAVVVVFVVITFNFFLFRVKCKKKIEKE
jgi:hypothetical protein